MPPLNKQTKKTAAQKQIKSGIVNEGYEYEKLVPAYFSLELILDPNVKSFIFNLNSSGFRKFDDLIITIVYTNTKEERFAIQLKHRQEGRDFLNAAEEFERTDNRNKGKSFNIACYQKAYQNEPKEVQNKYKFILFTNVTFSQMQCSPKYDISEVNQPFDTNLFIGSGIFHFEDPKIISSFWSNFFLVSGQKKAADIETTIIKTFVERFHSDEQTAVCYINFFQRLRNSEYNNTEITKDAVVLNLVKFLTTGLTIPTALSHTKDHKIHLIEEALQKFDLTVLNISRSFVETNWKLSNKDNKNYTETALDFKLLRKNESLTDVSSQVLSLVKKKPLFLNVTEGSENLVDVINSMVATVEDHKVTLVLVGRFEPSKHRNTFQSLQDLKSYTELYRSFLETFKISFQGREPRTLQDLHRDGLNLDQILTPNEVFQFLEGDLLVGKQFEKLQFYIPRTFVRPDVTINRLKTLSALNTTVVHCGGSPNIFQVFNTNHQKSVILTDDDEIQENQLTYNHLKLTHDSLQWLENKIDSESPSLFNNNLVLITGESGIGKTTLLKNLALKCPQNYWVATVTLQQVSPVFKADFDVNQVLKKFLAQNRDLDQRVCDYLLSLKKVVFMFDGLNELNNNVIGAALRIIKKISQSGYKVWISCTKNLREFVEDALDVSHSYVVEDITYEDQKKYVCSRLRSVNVNEETINNVIQNLFHRKKPDEILKLPLILYIFTENFCRNDNIDWELNLNQLYSSFIEGQFEHNLTKSEVNNLSNIKIIIEGFKNYNLAGYQFVALQTCLDPHLFLKFNIKVDKTFVPFITTNGDFLGLLKVNNGTINFSHRTFDEYFASMWLSDNFKDLPNEERDFIFRSEYEGIKRFFDARLAEGCPLHLAVLGQNLTKTKSLAEKHLNDRDNGGRTALHLASSNCWKHQILSKNQDNIWYKSPDKSSNNAEDIVRYLLSMNATPLAQDTLFGWNCFEYAGASSCLLALEEMSKTEEVEWEWLKAYHQHLFSLSFHCITKGYINLLKVVIKKISLKVLEQHHQRKPLLHLALQSNQEDIVKLLLDYGVNLKQVDFQKQTPLHEAAISGNVESVNLLLDHIVDIDPEDFLGRTPLHLAAKMGNNNVVKLLVEKGASIDAVDSQLKTPLLKAAYTGRTKVVKYLVDNGANIHAQTIDRATPLHRAAEMGHLNTVETLVQRGAKVDATEKYQKTALHYAAYEGHEDVVKYLVEQKVNISLVDEDKNTARQIAEKRRHQKVVNILQAAEKKDSSRNFIKVKESDLHEAAKQEDWRKVKKLLATGADIEDTDHHGETLLHIAGFKGNLSMVCHLLSLNANTAATSKDGRVPLHLACHGGHLQVVQELLNKGQNSALDNWKLEPIHRAAYKGHKTIVEILINAGVDVNTTSGEGLTPLHSAAYGGHLDLIEWLLANGADIERKQKKKETCLHVAVQKGWTKTVEFLMKKKRDIIDEVDSLGRTALHLAAQRNSTYMVDVLVRAGADVEKVDYCGKTALDLAVDAGRLEIVRYLQRAKNKSDQ